MTELVHALVVAAMSFVAPLAVVVAGRGVFERMGT
jgi:hypothetical protein